MALIDKIKAIADAIRERTGITAKMSLDEMAETISYMDVGSDDTQTYILVDENGVEYPAVLVDDPVVLTATRNDVRLGTTAVTEEGVITGEKEIPPYYATSGTKAITNGSEFVITVRDYDYTKLQVILCPFNSSITKSVSAEKVVIDDVLYPVRSNTIEANVVVNHDLKRIELGITNNSGSPYVIRYFNIKEMY